MVAASETLSWKFNSFVVAVLNIIQCSFWILNFLYSHTGLIKYSLNIGIVLTEHNLTPLSQHRNSICIPSDSVATSKCIALPMYIMIHNIVK